MVEHELSIDDSARERMMAALAHAAARMTDISPAFEKIADQIYEEEEAIFAASGSYGGREAWQADSPKWRARKEKLGAPTDPMRFTENLWRSLTSRTAQGAIFELDAEHLLIGSDVTVSSEERMEVYWHTVLTGTAFRKGRIVPQKRRTMKMRTVGGDYNLGYIHHFPKRPGMPSRKTLDPNAQQEMQWAAMLEEHLWGEVSV
jgi:hypothetical protein